MIVLFTVESSKVFEQLGYFEFSGCCGDDETFPAAGALVVQFELSCTVSLVGRAYRSDP